MRQAACYSIFQHNAIVVIFTSIALLVGVAAEVCKRDYLFLPPSAIALIFIKLCG